MLLSGSLPDRFITNSTFLGDNKGFLVSLETAGFWGRPDSLFHAQNKLNVEGMCKADGMKLSKCQLHFQKEGIQKMMYGADLSLLLF